MEEAWSIKVNEELCIGSGDCAMSAPLAFFLGPDDLTTTVLPTANDSNLEHVQDAIAGCPTGALSVELGDASSRS